MSISKQVTPSGSPGGAESDAEVIQVIGRQLRQYRSINGVLAKRLLVLLQPETTKPSRDVHARLHDAVTAARGYRTPNYRCARMLNAACRTPRSRGAACRDRQGDRPLLCASATPSRDTVQAILGQNVMAGDFDALEDALESNTAYANIHTIPMPGATPPITAYPGGEIRGQVHSADHDHDHSH